MRQLLVFYALIALGFLVGKRYDLRKPAMRLLLYVLLPLLILQAISANFMEFLSSLPKVFLMMISTIAVSYAASRILLRGYEPVQRVTLTLTAVRPNALFLPLAIAIALGLPDQKIVIIFAYSLAYNVLQPLITPLIVAEVSKKQAKKGLKLPTLRAALIALLLGILGHPVELPGYNRLKVGVSYGSLIYVGLRLSKAPEPRSDLLPVALVRFVIAPLVLRPLIATLSADELEKYILLIEASSAPAVSNVIYAHYFELDASTASRIVTYLNALGTAIDYAYRLLIRAFIFGSSYRLGRWL